MGEIHEVHDAEHDRETERQECVFATDAQGVEGLLEDVEIRLPPGSLLNPTFHDDPTQCPAVVGGNVEVSQRVVDTLLKALGTQACSQGTMNNFLFGNARFGYYETIGGGAVAGSRSG